MIEENVGLILDAMDFLEGKIKKNKISIKMFEKYKHKAFAKILINSLKNENKIMQNAVEELFMISIEIAKEK